MNVQEQHIELNILIQKIASNVNRGFDPSELDWILNKMVDRFIKDRIKQDQDSLGFDATQIDLDALRTVVRNDVVLPVFAKSSDTDAYAELPGDYAHHISSRSSTVEACNSSQYRVASRRVTETEYIYTYPLRESAKTSPKYYTSIKVDFGGSTLISMTTGGLDNRQELFTVRYLILSRLWALELGNINFYWERYGSVYKPDSIIAVSKTPVTGLTGIVIDDTRADAVASTISKVRSTSVPVNKWAPNRVIRGHMRDTIMDSSFASSRANSPIASVDNNRLKIYCGERFLLNKLSITYVRKPAKISLTLNQSCDLPEEFHPQICDRAAVFIKELTLNPDWEIRLRDMMANKD